MGAKGSVEAAKINAQNWNSLEVRVLVVPRDVDGMWSNSYAVEVGFVLRRFVGGKRGDGRSLLSQMG